VNVRLNFDKEVVNSVEFSPPVEGEENGLVRSSEEQLEVTGNSPAAIGAVGTDSNGVSDTEYVYTDEEGNNEFSHSSSKTYNYELNQIQKQIEKAQGTIEDLSVAVLVNNQVEGISGNLDKIENLVAAAIGVDKKYVSAEALPFVESAAGKLDFEDYFQQNQDTLRRISRNNLIRTVVILAAIPIIALIIIFALRKKPRAVDEIAGTEEELLEALAEEPIEEEGEEFNIDKLLEELGSGRSPAVERIGELVDSYPETVVQVLRSWLSEED
jgi:flagellar M-ring protein FliF